MQGNLWPGSASGGGGGSAASCVLGAESMSSSCMSPYPHAHGNLQGFMGMTPSPGHHHHHHPPHHPGINSLYSLHSFPGGLGSPSLEPHESEYKPAGLVALRMKAKDPGSLLSWPTWPRQCQPSIMHWLSQTYHIPDSSRASGVHTLPKWLTYQCLKWVENELYKN